MVLYLFLGWLNFSLFAVITSPFWIGFLNKRFFHTKSQKYQKFIRMLRQIHKPLGLALAGLSFVHGYLALGSIRPHTGILAALAVCAVVVLGIVFFRTKKRTVFLWHRGIALALFFLLMVHIIFPNALYALIR